MDGNNYIEIYKFLVILKKEKLIDYQEGLLGHQITTQQTDKREKKMFLCLSHTTCISGGYGGKFTDKIPINKCKRNDRFRSSPFCNL